MSLHCCWSFSVYFIFFYIEIYLRIYKQIGFSGYVAGAAAVLWHNLYKYTKKKNSTNTHTYTPWLSVMKTQSANSPTLAHLSMRQKKDEIIIIYHAIKMPKLNCAAVFDEDKSHRVLAVRKKNEIMFVWTFLWKKKTQTKKKQPQPNKNVWQKQKQKKNCHLEKFPLDHYSFNELIANACTRNDTILK